VTHPQSCALCGLRPVGYTGRGYCYTCVPRKKNGPRPRICSRCAVNPVGYSGRDCCYTCVPRRRKAPLACKRCGSGDFYTAGLCRRCHRMAPLVDSCRDCLSWGVTRHDTWLCQACRGWRRRYHESNCPGCGRQLVVNHRGYCRLCCRQATAGNRAAAAHTVLDMSALTRGGQQLFLADLVLKKRGKQFGATAPAPRRVLWPAGYPAEHQQLVLFAWPRDLSNDNVGNREPPIPALAGALQHAVADHGDRHGWTKGQRDRTWRGIRVLLAVQDTPGARITMSEANELLDVEHASLQPVLEVLDSVGMLHDDRLPPLEAWFANHTAQLPDTMHHELAVWFHALRDGSTSPPRMRPRHIDTVRTKVWAVLPIIKRWAADGHQSMREITRDHVAEALAATPRRRATLSPLRGLFRYLKASKLTFLNPTARLRGDPIPATQPLPIELGPVRDALKSDDPANAAIAALIAFHALRNGQVRQLLLTDIRDGRLHVDGNSIVMADPVRQRINAWLTERARRWPNTANPHLFISFRTAVRTSTVSSVWISDRLGVSPQKLREDRILNEAIASGGDVRRLCDLFGVSVGTAQRYADVVLKPKECDLTDMGS
jgi:hypothetical protein